MIGYITLGSNNIPEATKFYDALFQAIGAKRVFTYETFMAWSLDRNTPMFSIVKPFDGNNASVGNGVMIALNASSPEQVQTLHAKAIELGATNEGDPGMREGGYYCAYFRDLDGNKLNFHCICQDAE